MYCDSSGVNVIEEEDERKDAFLAFIEYAGSALWQDEVEEDDAGLNSDGGGLNAPGWSWIASRILKTCVSYSSGLTPAILLSELSQTWNEQHRSGDFKKRPELIRQLKRNHRRAKLQNTVTIDAIHAKNFLSIESVLEAVIIDVFVLPGTDIYMLTLGDFWSSSTIDLYLHRRYYKLLDPCNDFLKKGREVFLTGCYLRTVTYGSGHSRLLPTEYLLIILDENHEDDSMLLAARFFSDKFSSILPDMIGSGVSYSFYCRIKSIGLLEILGRNSSLQRKQISLVDMDGNRQKFVLWGEQVVLANLFSVGSMLALDHPFVGKSSDIVCEGCGEFCLEFGTETQLYLVPFLQHEEQVSVSLTEDPCQGSRINRELFPTQSLKVSQLTLPCDSLGTIDFSNYPFRTFVIDLHHKMSSFSLYGVATDISRLRNHKEAVFLLKIEDPTGVVSVKLHFSKSWSLGRISHGHTVFISGLTCVMTKQKCLEVQWLETDSGTASIFNISSLPAMLSSSCLHRLSCLSNLSRRTRTTHICRVQMQQREGCEVNTRFSHSICGRFVDDEPYECHFCGGDCAGEVVRTFHFKITLADGSAKVFAWCCGPTATELLRISADEFCEMDELDQLIYTDSMGDDKFMVALVNCSSAGGDVEWEIARAQVCV